MMVKNTERGKCPFRELKTCSEKCVLYRKGFRYKSDGSDPIPFEDCAFNIMADNIEATHGKIFNLQQEMGETKNVIALKTLVDVGINVDQNANTLMKHINKILLPPSEPAKQLKP